MLKLPLFPLNLVLLPYEVLPLHIFEERYKKMVRNAIEDNHPFGIILNEDKGLFSKGCKVKVTKVYKKYDNGEYDILVEGSDLFNVISTNIYEGTVIGEVEFPTNNQNPDYTLINQIRDSYLKVIIQYGVDNNLDYYMNKKVSYEFLSGIQLPIEIKKALVKLDVETDRLKFINKIFKNILKNSRKLNKEQTHQA
jgi:Lon protease-like protein